VPAKGALGQFGATSSGSTPPGGFTGLVPIPPYRLASAVTPEGTYAYTYEDDPPEIRLGALSFTDGTGSRISPEDPDCRNVRGGRASRPSSCPG
jgi:hypothetical protein